MCYLENGDVQANNDEEAGPIGQKIDEMWAFIVSPQCVDFMFPVSLTKFPASSNYKEEVFRFFSLAHSLRVQFMELERAWQ